MKPPPPVTNALTVRRSDFLAIESLTTAELRVLRFLPSHLSFREIAARLHVSANTVKTQAHAVYRKLDASSRSGAVGTVVRTPCGIFRLMPS